MTVQRKVRYGAAGASVSAAAMTVVLYVLGLVPFIAGWPAGVRDALALVLLAGATSAGSLITGYLTNTQPKGPTP